MEKRSSGERIVQSPSAPDPRQHVGMPLSSSAACCNCPTSNKWYLKCGTRDVFARSTVAAGTGENESARRECERGHV